MCEVMCTLEEKFKVRVYYTITPKDVPEHSRTKSMFIPYFSDVARVSSVSAPNILGNTHEDVPFLESSSISVGGVIA